MRGLHSLENVIYNLSVSAGDDIDIGRPGESS
jgi:hypothetical protein